MTKVTIAKEIFLIGSVTLIQDLAPNLLPVHLSDYLPGSHEHLSSGEIVLPDMLDTAAKKKKKKIGSSVSN